MKKNACYDLIIFIAHLSAKQESKAFFKGMERGLYLKFKKKKTASFSIGKE